MMLFLIKYFSSALAYVSRLHLEAVAMCHSVTYTPYDTSSKEKTGDIIKFTQFEEWKLLSKTREDAESGDESSDASIMPPLHPFFLR